MAGRKKRDGPLNYFELPRKQLQSLCKKYGFPANKTNLLMAEFLTAHLNSEEYLNRDMSCPSPSVKTRFQCRDEEAATDDDTPTISESARESELAAVSETEATSAPQDTINVDVQQTDHPLEVSTAAEGGGLGEVMQMGSEDGEGSLPKEETKGFTPEGVGLGEVMQMGSQDVEGSLPKEETKDVTPSGFRIREACLQFKGGSGQDSSVPPPNTEEATDAGSGHLSTSEEATDFTSTSFASLNTSLESQKAQQQRLETTPLPLSIMPYVRAVTPGSGVKLFVDLQSEGLSSAENPSNYYGTWGAQLSSNAVEMADEVILGSSKTSEGSERSLPILSSDSVSDSDKGPERTDREAEDGGGELESMAYTSSVKADAAPLKSCLLTPNRKPPSPRSVSFVCPSSFSSPRGINVGLVLDAERSVIVKEWNADQCEPMGGIVRSELEKAANGELLQNIDETLLAKESSELDIRTPPKSAADVEMESPSEGVVEQVVKIYDEKRLSAGPSSIQRSALRRGSYKASPMLKSSRIAAELERASKLGQTRRVGLLALKRAMGVTPVFSSDVEKESETPASDSASVGVAVGAGNTSTTPHVRSPDRMAIEVAEMQGTGVSPSDMEVTVQNHSSPVAELLLPGQGFENEDATMSNEGIAEKDEETNSEMDTNGHEAEESEGGAEADEVVSVPATVEESVANLSWMTKPIQLPTRRPVQQKHKEKPGRPLSANRRTLELMERASAKLKMMRKGAADRGEAVSSRPKTSTSTSVTVTTSDPEVLQIRGGEHVEPVCEVAIAETVVAEHPVAELETAADTVSPSEETSRQLKDNTLKESSYEALIRNGTMSIVPDEKLNVNERPNAIESVSTESPSVCAEDYASKESSYEALIRNGTTSIVPDEKLSVNERPDAVESVSMESQSVCEEGPSKTQHTAAQKPSAALSFLDIDFTKISVPKANAGPQPETTLEIDSAQAGEQIAAEKPTHPLMPFDSNRRATDATTDNSPNPTSPPAKTSGVLDGLSESEENNNGFSPFGKENEWSKRQEQHKTPLTGRSKEKALRTAETKASNLREQLLRKRRGMMDQLTDDAEDDSVASVQASPLMQLATNRLL